MKISIQAIQKQFDVIDIEDLAEVNNCDYKELSARTVDSLSDLFSDATLNKALSDRDFKTLAQILECIYDLVRPEQWGASNTK